MPPALLHLRLLALPLALLLVAPTLGSTGAEEPAAPATATAALALMPADASSEVGGSDAAAPAADDRPAAPSSPEPKAQEADAPQESRKDQEADRKPAKAEAPQEGQKDQEADRKPAKAEAPQKGQKGQGQGQEADTPQDDEKGQKADRGTAKDDGRAAASTPKKKQAEPAAKKARAAAAAKPDVPPRTLYLAVGHGRAPNGRWDPGAGNTRTGAFEIDSAQVMVDAMVEVLREAPNLQLEFESGDHPNVIGSVARANARGVDDCIEVHQDMAAAPPGVFAHWYPGAKGANRLADRMVHRVANQGLGIRHDWHRPRPSMYFVRKSTCRAVLIEVGRVGDFDVEQLRTLGVTMARAYLADTKKARGIGG